MVIHNKHLFINYIVTRYEKKAGIYVRVSTEHQAREGYSLDEQAGIFYIYESYSL